MKCVLTTSKLVSTVSCFDETTMNFVQFADEKLLTVSALSNSGGMTSGVS